MPRLVLIRHAKTERLNPHGDHARELIERGYGDARALGRWLTQEGCVADLAIVSTAARAQQTFTTIVKETGAIEHWDERRIYDGDVLEAVNEAPDHIETLWVVGHEPVLSALIWELADEDAMAENLFASLSEGFPTSTAAVLEFSAGWGAITPDAGRLVALHAGRRPR